MGILLNHGVIYRVMVGILLYSSSVGVPRIPYDVTVKNVHLDSPEIGYISKVICILKTKPFHLASLFSVF